MNLFLRFMFVLAISVMTSFRVYAQNPTANPKPTAPPADRTVIRKAENFPHNIPKATVTSKKTSSETDNSIVKSSALTAKDIITKMAATYKNCTSYLDSGVVNTTFFMKKGSYVDKVQFATAFKRPGQFRFGFSLKPPKKDAEIKHHIIFVKDKKILVWQNPETGVEEESSLSDAIADAVATSGGAAQTIPVLIGASQVGGRSIADMFNKQRLPDAAQDGAICFRIQGQRTKAEPGRVTLWIDQKTFLIRRIDSSHKFKDFKTETTKIYRPQVNVSVPEDRLEFNIPGQNKNTAK